MNERPFKFHFLALDLMVKKDCKSVSLKHYGDTTLKKTSHVTYLCGGLEMVTFSF